MKRLLVVLAILSISCLNVAAQDSLTKEPNSLYICTFNVYRLGAEAAKYKAIDDEEGAEPVCSAIPDRIENLARVLAVGKFDLVVLQEVHKGLRGEWVLSDLARELKDTHNLKYRHFMSGDIGQGFGMNEAMGFLYNDDKIKPREISGQTKQVDNIEISGRDLVRTQWAAGDFDFTLISAHLAWENEQHRNEGYEKVQDILTTATPSQYSWDPDIIVLGDFNRFGNDYESVKRMTYDPEKYLAPNVTFFDPEFTSLKRVTKASIQGQGKDVPGDNPQLISTTVGQEAWVYDIIFMTKDCDEEYPGDASSSVYGEDFGIIHFDEKDGFGYQQGADTLDHNNLKVAYSDHRPLWMCFRTNAGHNDGPVLRVDPTWWCHDPETEGDWSNPDNWKEGVPTESANAKIDNDGTAGISLMPSNAEARNLYVGYSDSGSVVQSGGITRITDDLYLGCLSGSNGTYDLAGGNLQATNIYAGGSGVCGGTGTLNVSSGGSVNADVLTIWRDGSVNMGGGVLIADTIKNLGTFRFTGGTLQVATFTGDLTNDGGTLAPGNSLGVTNIEGNYEQTDPGTLLIQLNTNDGDEQCDALTVNGGLGLAGTLALNWLEVDNDWDSMFGGLYTIATYTGDLTGGFDSLSGSISTDYVAGVDYGVAVPGEITVTLHDQLYGDCNLDGTVNLTDIVVSINNWQAVDDEATWFTGDVNFSGVVDLADIVVMIRNWQATPVCQSTGGTQAVPEPGTMFLLALGACLPLLRRRR